MIDAVEAIERVDYRGTEPAPASWARTALSFCIDNGVDGEVDGSHWLPRIGGC